MEESIIKNVIKFMCAHGNIDVLFKNEEEFYEEYKQAQALQLQQTDVVGRSEQLPCPHCDQLEPCAGNSPETCYHPKVC